MEHTSANGVIDLQHRINHPDTSAALIRLLDRIESLEQAVTTLAEMVQQIPGVVAMATDVVDETYRQAQRSGMDLEQRFKQGAALLGALTEPRTATILSRLIEHIDAVEPLLEIAEHMPKAIATGVDILDDTYRQATAAGIDIESMWQRGAETAAKLCAAVCSDEFDAIMASGILEPATLGVVGRAGEALTHSQRAAPQQPGWLDLLRALRDPDVRQAVAFALTFAKQFGRSLGASHTEVQPRTDR
jgi:uncharacterized protein YjgD (DUF1641 family)